MNSGIARAVAALGVIVVAVWGGVRVYSLGHAVTAGAALPTPTGQASPPGPSDMAADALAAGDGARAPVIPERLPSFTLGDRTGRPTPVSTWAGKSLVLNFWATWCAPCRREIPLLNALQAAAPDGGVQVVGIAVDHRDKVVAFADELRIRYPLLIGEEDALDVAARFGFDAPAFPFTVFTDRRGEVVALFVGELHRPQVDLILAVVRDLNASQVALADARRVIATGLRELAEKAPG